MIQHELVQLGRGLLRRIQTSLPTEERRTNARDESFHGVFLCMFHLSKSIRRSSRVFRETKRIEGRPARPSIHRAIRRGARGERILMIQQDRKSVVSGKSVSVRVNLVGRRYIKKK